MNAAPLVAPPAAPLPGAAVRSSALVVAVGLGVFVAAAHLQAAVSAFGASPPIALVLCAVGLGAAAWSLRVALRPTRALLALGAAGATALVGLWIVTRTAGGAPVGVLDALTALDELLLAGFALAAARERPGERWPPAGMAAISLSFMALAMGCEPPAAPAAQDGGRTPSAICHLY
jgi:hypothetical protein